MPSIYRAKPQDNCVYYLRLQRNGVRKAINTGCYNYGDAERWALALLKDKKRLEGYFKVSDILPVEKTEKLPKQPCVYLKTFNNYTCKTYYFKLQRDGVRKEIATGCSNKREAMFFAKSLANNPKKLDALFGEERKVKASVNLERIFDEKTRRFGTDSFLYTIKEQGWLSVDTFPKRQQNIRDGKCYGRRQAYVIGKSLSDMFIKSDKYDWFARKPIKDITIVEAQKLADELFKNRKKNGVPIKDMNVVGNYRSHINALKAVFTFNHKYFANERNPFSGIAITRTKSDTRKNVFDLDTMKFIYNKELLADCFNDEEWLEFLNSVWFKAICFLGLTGLRSGELRCLRWKQVDENDAHVININYAFKDGTYEIGLPKWNKCRVIVLADTALELLPDKRGRAEDFIFTYKGKPLSYNLLNDKFQYFIGKLASEGVFEEHYTLHGLRATLNSRLLFDTKVSNALIARYFGWTSGNTGSTMVQDKYYTVDNIQDLTQVAYAIENLYSGKEMSWRFSYNLNASPALKLANLIKKGQKLKELNIAPNGI